MLILGEILTMADPARAGAVYLEGSRIADLGPAEDLQARYPAARRFRVQRVTPGLHDAHIHPVLWGRQLSTLDLSGLHHPEEVAARVAERSRELPAGSWIRGAGYLFDAYPDKALLDRAAPHHPVFLQSRDLHSGWVNSRALEQARITSTTADPKGGVILRDAAGEPTGCLLERATDLVHAVLPGPTVQELALGLTDLARRGYTAAHHLGWCPLAFAEELARRGELPVRLWWALDKEGWREAEPRWRGDALEVAAVKFFADGALGSRTAWMLEPYPDGSFGMPLDDLEFIREEGRAALSAGFGLAVHAIGTRAVRGVLAVFGELAQLHPRRPLRMEHAQHVQDADLPSFRGLPMAVSMQPIHALEDAALVRQHQPGREHEAFRLRDLWNTGLPLAFGSDAPVAPPDVLGGLQAALSHPIAPAQSLGEAQALWAFTRGAALAAGWPEHGQIRAQAPADLTLWEAGKPVGRVFRGELELF
ncbi:MULTISPECIES: amidohydrolase [unclassified Meiothermus]|uniref:amidohydrolase n=1 Tax=unclassified Meiothermus TaxID=370471 RepID=UPI000D7BEC7D|nr:MULTISPECIES: amidohydrolase [unclassified Meiothermus]PZA07049.1 amidohydrolase [Meiothermus sp. Pnk-1]RYM34271.1 amidohydrolase [Meiothermus sp. PNK-Is4]